MKKIPTIFKRNSEDMRKLLRDPHPDCAWVFKDEGVATRKYDGTCCMIDKGVLYKRREVKKGKPAPDGFIKISTDETTGKSVGWVLVDVDEPNDQHHAAAFSSSLADGTYELVGPKVQGNPEKYSVHTLIEHTSAEEYSDVPRAYDGLCEWLKGKDIEGLVFHHLDGRMAKIKKKDFQLTRQKESARP